MIYYDICDIYIWYKNHFDRGADDPAPQVEVVSTSGVGKARLVRRIGKNRHVHEADMAGEFAGLLGDICRSFLLKIFVTRKWGDWGQTFSRLWVSNINRLEDVVSESGWPELGSLNLSLSVAGNVAGRCLVSNFVETPRSLWWHVPAVVFQLVFRLVLQHGALKSPHLLASRGLSMLVQAASSILNLATWFLPQVHIFYFGIFELSEPQLN